MEQRIASFEEFWPFYVKAHASKWNRRLHFAGTTAAMAVVGVSAITLRPSLLLLAPVVGYGPAWFGHFVIEGNKPATFGYPTWSLKADLVMWSKMLAGTMDAEVARVLGADAERAERAERAEGAARAGANGAGEGGVDEESAPGGPTPATSLN
jgi:hypothetical protein